MNYKPYQILDSTIKGLASGIKMFERPYRTYLLFRFVAHRKLFEESEENKGIRWGFMRTGGGLATPEELRAQKYSSMAFLEFYRQARYAERDNRPLVWFDWPVPVAVIKAFNCAWFTPAAFFFLSQPRGGVGVVNHLTLSEEAGVSSDICSQNRIALGAYFARQVPQPAAFIGATQPCDSTIAINQIFEHYAGVPSFIMDSAYERDDASISHLADNTFEMIEFLERALGQKMDWNKMKAVAENINRYNHHMREITGLMQAVPSPGLALHLTTLWILNIGDPGSVNVVKAAEILHGLAVKRVTKRNRIKFRREKIRVIMADMDLAYAEVNSWMWKEFGAVVVSDYVGDVVGPDIDVSTKESLIRGLVEERLTTGMIRQAHGPARYSTENLRRAIRDYSADCVIFNGHIGCKHNNAVRKIMQDTVSAAGLPFLYLGLDIYDQRVMPESEVKKAIRNFFISNGLAQ